jgi:hypothetical protein
MHSGTTETRNERGAGSSVLLVVAVAAMTAAAIWCYVLMPPPFQVIAGGAMALGGWLA